MGLLALVMTAPLASRMPPGFKAFRAGCSHVGGQAAAIAPGSDPVQPPPREPAPDSLTGQAVENGTFLC